jgi:flagellar hook-associated protein 1 FlgK
MGLTTTVSLVANGLKVVQDATTLVAGNIANASTDGYTNKTLAIRNLYADGGTIGFKTSVERAFDQEVYNQLVSSTASTAYLDTQSTYLTQLDQLMGSTSSGATLPTAISSLSSDLQTLASEPSNSAAQIAVVNSATALAQSLNSLSSTVSDMKSAVEGDIDEAVSSVNTLTSQIGTLNTQIIAYSAQGRDITGLQDDLDQAVLKLSSYMDVQVNRETNGSVRVATTAALTLVDGSRATQFARDSDGSLVLANDGAGTTDVMALGMVRSGSLQSLYDVRETLLPQVSDQLDQVAASLAKTFSSTSTAGTATSSGGLTGYDSDLTDMQSGDVFRVSYTDVSTGATKTVDFVKVTDAASLPLDDSSDSSTHSTVGIDFSGGVTSAATQIQSVLGSGFTVSNPTGDTIEVLGDGSTVSVTGTLTQATATATSDGTVALPLFTDGSAIYTGATTDGVSQIDGFASRIGVNSAVRSDPSLLVAYSATTESSDTTRPNQLLSALKNTTNYTTLGAGAAATAQTLTGFTDSMVSYWGTRKSNASTDLSNQQVVQDNLTSAMRSGSAVSTDTELAKLIQLQAVYTANAQVLTTIKDMLSSLLNAV